KKNMRSVARSKTNYRQLSRQVQRNPGYISSQSQKPSYGGMQSNTVRNPQVRNMKSLARQKTNFRQHSRQIQKGYGADPIISGNRKLMYKFNSQVAQKYTGSRKYTSSKQDFRQASRKQTKSRGDLVLQPKMLQKNYNELRPSGDRQANRSRMRTQQDKQKDYRQSSAQLQKYSGSVLLSRNATKLSGKYHSKIVQQDRGMLRKKDVKSAAGNR